jgi:hypothetical protein
VPGRQELHGDALKLALFLEFHELVVRDGLDPQRVHEAFLVIDEYAESIAPHVRDVRWPSFEDRMLRKLEEKTAWKKGIARCFGELDVIFANHPLDGKRARAAIRAAKYAEASRDDFEKEMVWHIYKEVTGEGRLQPHIRDQVKTLHRLWDEVIPGQPDKPFEPAGLCYFMGPQGLVVERGLPGAKPTSAGHEPDLCARATGAAETLRCGFWSTFKRGIVGAFHKTSASPLPHGDHCGESGKTQLVARKSAT